MWGLALVKIIAFLLTAFVCEKFDNINILLLVMAGAAGVSLFGAYLFKAYDDGMTGEEKLKYHIQHANIVSNTYTKWQKS